MASVKINSGFLGLTLVVMQTGGAQLVYAADGHATAAQVKVAGKSDARSSDKEVISSLLSRARYWKTSNRIDLAAKTWSRILLSNPLQPDALAELSLYEAKMGHLDRANGYLSKLKQVDHRHPAIPEIEDILSPQATAAATAAAGFDVKVASRHLSHGNLRAAKAAYLHALKLVPDFPDGLLGAAEVSLKQKQFDEALVYIDRYVELHQPSRHTDRIRSECYTGKGEEADKAGQTVLAASYYASAQEVNPDDPWIMLSLARAQRLLGDVVAATVTIAKLTDRNVQTRDRNYAASIYYSEENKWEQVLALLDQIPEKDRTGPIKDLHVRAVVHVNSELAKRLYANQSDSRAINMMSKVEKDAAGKAELIAVTAAAWADIQQPEQAIGLLERNVKSWADLVPQYAGLLLQTKQDDKLQRLLEEVDRSEHYKSVRNGLDEIRIALNIRQADKYRESNELQRGKDTLAPMLSKHPQDVGLLLAQARLSGAERDSAAALKNVDAVLAQQAGNHEALRLGVTNAIHMDNFVLADDYLASARMDDPHRADLYLEAAHAAEEVNNNEEAQSYFLAAKRSDGKDARVSVIASPEAQFSGSDVRHVWYAETGYGIRYKSGMRGLGYLYENELPVALHKPLADKDASLVVKASAVKLDAGDAGLALDLFGTNRPAVPVVVPYPIKAQGVAASVGYQSTSVSADIGLSPVGFLFGGAVGGVRWNRAISDSNIALEASRRSVAESVLSYAGVVDNVTRIAWGGVSKTGGQASLYFPIANAWAGYVSGGLYEYTGHNTAANSSNQASMALIYEWEHTDNLEATIAARVSRLSFNNNQNHFYWGHGGYYSPQRDASFSIPLSISGKTQKLSYAFNVTSSLSDVVESPAQIYPTDPLRQAALGAAGTVAGSNVKSKSSWGADWVVEYMLGSQWTLGNRFQISESRNYQLLAGMFYLRYDFEPGRRTTMPTNTLRPYYLTTQGAAGLN